MVTEKNKVNIKNILFHLDKDKFHEVEKKAIVDLSDLNRNYRIKSDIFSIIKRIDNLHLLVFPIEDEQLNAFTIFRNEKSFIYVNSYLPLNLQIFAATHEFYHNKYNKGSQELLEDVESKFNGDINEMVANSYAACLLVPRIHLEDEMNILNITKGNIGLIDILKLMDSFAVPYKAMVLRLFETGFLTEDEANEFLKIQDKNPKEGVALKIIESRIGVRWEVRTREIEFSNLIQLAVDNFEDANFSAQKIIDDLSGIGVSEEIVSLFIEGDLSGK